MPGTVSPLPRQTAESTKRATPPWRLVADRGVPRPAGLHWLADQQAAALGRIAEAGLPDGTHEAWRQTSLRDYARRWSESLEREARDGTTHPAPAAGTQRPEPAGQSLGEYTIDLIDGRPDPWPGAMPPGVELAALRTLPPPWRDRVVALLEQRGEGPAPDPLVDLNTALLDDGLLIATPEGSQESPTIHVRNHLLAPTSLVQSRILVDVGPRSRLTLIVEHDGAPSCLSNTVLQVRLGADSRLNLVRVQALPDDALATETTFIEVAAAAQLGATSVDMGAQLSRQTLTINLAGPGATAEVQGMFLADGHRHIDNQTSLIHRAPETISRELFLGIADNHGRGVFGGRVLVLPGATGSNAALTNRNLLLTSAAEIDTKPELEIYVDDVRCSHGATTGQLDANALFYLQSRGLDLGEARRILTVAFLRQGFSRIPDPVLRARLDAQLVARLARSVAVGPLPQAALEARP